MQRERLLQVRPSQPTPRFNAKRPLYSVGARHAGDRIQKAASDPKQPDDKPGTFSRNPEVGLNRFSQIATVLVLAGCLVVVLTSCASPTLVGTWGCDGTTVEHERYTIVGESTFSANASGVIRSTIDYQFEFRDTGDLVAQLRIIGDWTIENDRIVEVVNKGEIVSMSNSSGVADDLVVEMLLTMHPAGEVIYTEFEFESRGKLRMTDLRNAEVYSCTKLSSDYE